MKANITLPTGFSRVLGRSKLVAHKYSPEILLGLGIAGAVTATVMACKATLKAQELKDKQDALLETIESTRETVDKGTYSDEDYQKDLVIHKVQTIMAFARLYGPAAAVGLASITAIIGSHGIMTKRTTSLMAAYGLLQEGFNKYRARVVADLGEDQDKVYRYGLNKEVTEERVVDEATGKKRKVESVTLISDPNGLSDYAKFFDEYSARYRDDPSLNLFFLKSQQAWANEKLKADGYLFLNDVYDMLGLKSTKAGQMVGWVYAYDEQKEQNGDGYVDFGLYKVYNKAAVNGWETVFIIDPNVDGVILDILPA